jgi:hypothetical protein
MRLVDLGSINNAKFDTLAPNSAGDTQMSLKH